MSATPRITLRFYLVQVRKERETDTYLPLGRFGENHDLNTFLQNEIPNWEKSNGNSIVTDFSTRKLMRRHSTNLHLGTRKMWGVVESGEYGHEAPIVNADSGEDSYLKKKKDAEMIPFYFNFYIPKNGTDGILVLQTYKQYGVQGVFTHTVKKAFREKYSNFILELKPLISKEIAEKFMTEGKVSRISFRDTDSRSQFSDFVDGTVIPREYFDVEINIIAKRGKPDDEGFLKRLVSQMSQRRELNDLIELSNFENTETKIVTTLNGRQRTVDIDRLESVGSFFDITDDITFDPNTEHPTFQSVHDAAEPIIDDTIVALGLS